MPEAMDGLLKGMERETVSARAELEALKKELNRARKRAAAEQREAEVCRRREELARGIGDSESPVAQAADGDRPAVAITEFELSVLQYRLDAVLVG